MWLTELLTLLAQMITAEVPALTSGEAAWCPVELEAHAREGALCRPGPSIVQHLFFFEADLVLAQG